MTESNDVTSNTIAITVGVVYPVRANSRVDSDFDIILHNLNTVESIINIDSNNDGILIRAKQVIRGEKFGVHGNSEGNCKDDRNRNSRALTKKSNEEESK